MANLDEESPRISDEDHRWLSDAALTSVFEERVRETDWADFWDQAPPRARAEIFQMLQPRSREQAAGEEQGRGERELAVWAAWKTVPSPAVLSWERLLRVTLAALIRGELEQQGIDRPDWEAVARGRVCFHPDAGPEPERLLSLRALEERLVTGREGGKHRMAYSFQNIKKKNRSH